MYLLKEEEEEEEEEALWKLRNPRARVQAMNITSFRADREEEDGSDDEKQREIVYDIICSC